jgi:hypothetical protein
MIIGISGYAQAGKDSLGDALVRQCGFEKASFATPMKLMAEAIDPLVGCSRRLSDLLREGGWERAKKEPEVRQFLQRLGTEGGRDIFGQDFWVEHTLNLYEFSPRLVICDVRFRNEAEAIRARGGDVVRITRPGFDAPNDHVSEHDLDGYSFNTEIYNDGSLDDLELKAQRYFDLLILARAIV